MFEIPILCRQHIFFSYTGTYLCGTARTRRIGFPADLVKTKRQEREMDRGDSDWRHCAGLVATVWKDKRLVYYLSSTHAPEHAEGEVAATTKRRMKDGREVTLDCPPTVAAYAKYMNGVDRLDQMTRQNKSKKAMKWYRRIETKLMEVSIYNAYVIEDAVKPHKVGGKVVRDFLQFKLDLAHQLIGDLYTPNEDKAGGRRRSETSENLTRLDRKDHWPVGGIGKEHRCVVCEERRVTYSRRNPDEDNPNPRRKTTMKCEKCQVYLCCNNKTNCFKTYHTLVVYCN